MDLTDYYWLIEIFFIAIAILSLLLAYLNFSTLRNSLDSVYLYMGCTCVVLAIFAIYIGYFGGIEELVSGLNR
ncbi:hypothetical protein ACOMCU_00700 [Lysinibacillus sp. UGB7]|uniref:hypothetical protein n=1 Tax=Lysinibacillus sp. UGB7 TaxID=3411039 RepID=UPI003B769428